MRKAFVEGVASIMLGSMMGLVPGMGAIATQTDWLDTPIEVEEIAWEEIPEEPVEETQGYGGIDHDPVRTHEVDEDWWVIDHGDDPDIPNELEEAGVIYGYMFNICPEWLYMTAHIETGGTYKYDVVSADGKCVGPMQINKYAQAERIEAYGLTAEDMKDPGCAMLVAGSLFRELFDEYVDPALVAYAYNGNTAGMSSYRKTGKITGYAKRLLEGAAEMERKHGK